MLRIEMMPAEYGDCIWIEYGKPQGRTYRVLIDGGLAECGKLLRKRIKALPPGERRFDLGVVTHIDTDHINGMINLLRDLPEGCGFDCFWFNGYDQIKPGGTKGIAQGIELSTLLAGIEAKEKRKFWNKPFRRKAVMLPDTGEPRTVTLRGGLRMTILGPNSRGISDLFTAWDKVVRESRMVPLPEEAPETYREEEPFPGEGAETLSVEELAESDFTQDDSPSNGSSIVLLAEYGEESVLLTGDAFPGDIVKGIRRILPAGEKLPLTAFKVPHHGSRNNNNNALFDAVNCRSYMVSTNGKKHGHPDREGIARILVHGTGDTALYFNYSHEANLVWSDDRLQSDYRYRAYYAGNGNMKIDLSE
ncbi:MAG TPA: hypothetical protein P5086_07020 [Prolixibacteraceae bacterium]|nr:hypothetical protein [Prolixibacteraceae bacterium]HPJ78035.1 hypothetical protein [Prolixibacteraceae bacterium]HRV89051.1 hypothetical protein [Prolixibacteraceae bacterium]